MPSVVYARSAGPPGISAVALESGGRNVETVCISKYFIIISGS